MFKWILSALSIGHLIPTLSFAGDEDGTGGDSWVSTLPEEVRTDPNITKYKSLDEFAKGHLNVVKMVGAKGVIVPKDDTDKDGWNKLYSALGRPEAPDKYDIKNPENLHASLKINEEGRKEFLKEAHEMGLTNKQAQKLYDYELKKISGGLTAREQADQQKLEQAATRMKAEWGKEYDTNVTMAKRLAVKLGGEKVFEELGDLGNNPAALNILAKAAKMLSEDATGRVGFSSLRSTASEAKSRLAAIKSDPNHAYMDEKHPNHAEAVKEVRALYLAAEGKDD